MSYKLQHKVIRVSVIFILFFVALPVFGTEISVNSKNQEIKTGDEFEVDIFLNTKGEAINALEGKILFSKELLEFKEIRDGGTIINFWIERPSVLRKTDAEIIFSGITPGGYNGNKGLIFSIIFKAKKDGTGTVAIHDIRALYNDGAGTEAIVVVSNLYFLISEQAKNAESAILKIKDNEPPELFVPEVTQDATIFEGRYFLVFATQDKGSGIDYYEIREGGGKFIRAKSPYLLSNQELNKKITVKAVDKSGNERIVILPPANPNRLYKYLFISLIFIILSVLVFLKVDFINKKINFKYNFFKNEK